MLTESIQCFWHFLSIVRRRADWNPKVQIIAAHIVVVPSSRLSCCRHYRPFRLRRLGSLLTAGFLLGALQIWSDIHDLTTKASHLIPLHLVIVIDRIDSNLGSFELFACSSRQWSR